ncbi:MAG: DUF2254 family protein, partial [Cytophagaceae bacterium]
DYLADLLIMRMNYGKNEVFKDKDNNVRIIIPEISFSELLEICISPIRIYGKKDVNILISLINLMGRLAFNDQAFKYRDVLKIHTEAILQDGKLSLENSMDRRSLEESMAKIVKANKLYFENINYNLT